MNSLANARRKLPETSECKRIPIEEEKKIEMKKKKSSDKENDMMLIV